MYCKWRRVMEMCCCRRGRPVNPSDSSSKPGCGLVESSWGEILHTPMHSAAEVHAGLQPPFGSTAAPGVGPFSALVTMSPVFQFVSAVVQAAKRLQAHGHGTHAAALMWQVWRTRMRVSAPAQRAHWMNLNAKVNIRARSERCNA